MSGTTYFGFLHCLGNRLVLKYITIKSTNNIADRLKFNKPEGNINIVNMNEREEIGAIHIVAIIISRLFFLTSINFLSLTFIHTIQILTKIAINNRRVRYRRIRIIAVII
jgi:hypothetical protein